MAIHVDHIEDPQVMEVRVSRRPRRRLYIFTGIAVFEWCRTDDDSWASDSMYISMRNFPDRPVIPPDRWIDAVAVASLASIYFRETAARDKVGFSVNSARPAPPSGDFPEEYGINTQLALLGNDARFYRVSFQLTVHVRM